MSIIYLSSIHPSFYLFIHQFYLSIYLSSMYLFISLPTHLHIHLSFYLSSSINLLSTHLSISPPIYVYRKIQILTLWLQWTCIFMLFHTFLYMLRKHVLLYVRMNYYLASTMSQLYLPLCLPLVLTQLLSAQHTKDELLKDKTRQHVSR